VGSEVAVSVESTLVILLGRRNRDIGTGLLSLTSAWQDAMSLDQALLISSVRVCLCVGLDEPQLGRVLRILRFKQSATWESYGLPCVPRGSKASESEDVDANDGLFSLIGA